MSVQVGGTASSVIRSIAERSNLDSTCASSGLVKGDQELLLNDLLVLPAAAAHVAAARDAESSEGSAFRSARIAPE